jgi:flagellar protein FlgJ
MGRTASLNHNLVNDSSSLRGLRSASVSDKDAALKEAAKQFEGLFMQQMLKEARNTKWDGGFAEGAVGAGGMEKYQEWRDDQLAQDLSTKGSLGIADMLIKQLSPRKGKDQLEAEKQAMMTAPKPAESAALKPFSGVPVLRNAQLAHPQSSPVMPSIAQLEAQTGVGLPTTEDTIKLRQMLQGRMDK